MGSVAKGTITPLYLICVKANKLFKLEVQSCYSTESPDRLFGIGVPNSSQALYRSFNAYELRRRDIHSAVTSGSSYISKHFRQAVETINPPPFHMASRTHDEGPALSTKVSKDYVS